MWHVNEWPGILKLLLKRQLNQLGLSLHFPSKDFCNPLSWRKVRNQGNFWRWSIVDSSRPLLPTWPCPRWLFRFTVNSKKLRFYIEKTIIIQESSLTSKIKTTKARFEWILFPGASLRRWSFATSLSRWNISKLGYCVFTVFAYSISFEVPRFLIFQQIDPFHVETFNDMHILFRNSSQKYRMFVNSFLGGNDMGSSQNLSLDFVLEYLHIFSVATKGNVEIISRGIISVW